MTLRTITTRETRFMFAALVCHGTLLYGQQPLANPQAHSSSRAQPSSTPTPTQAPTNSVHQLGQLPDTISAPPFTVSQKFHYRVIQVFGLRGFVGAAVGAAIGQAQDSPHEWGQGATGFADRFGSGFGGTLTRQTFEFALEAPLHEDPRYFPSKDKRTKTRIVNALKQVLFCKTDDGTDSFAYARVISSFGAGQFINVWQPASTGSVGDGFKRAFIGLGTDAAFNAMQEFLPFTRPSSLRHRH